MAKLYSKSTWIDEVLAGNERYNILEDGGAAYKSNMQINLATAVTQAGTTANASRMNNLENGVDALDTRADYHNLTSKTTPVDADELPLSDSAATFAYKKLTWANLKATLKTYLDTLYASIAIGADGWTADSATWTYASASTFTISGDQTARFPVGTKIKLTQTTVKYFYVLAASYGAPNTTVTICAGTSYSLANATITSPYYSYAMTPQGFPQWFNFAPAWTGLTVTGSPIYSGTFMITGRQVNFTVSINPNGGTTASAGTTTYVNNFPFNFGSDFIGYVYDASGSAVIGNFWAQAATPNIKMPAWSARGSWITINTTQSI